MKLLMIDQDRDLVEMLSVWLEARGCDVAHVCTAQRAKALWAPQRPDLVLVDVSLKEKEALALCRGMHKVHEAFLFALAAQKDLQEEIGCLEAGA